MQKQKYFLFLLFFILLGSHSCLASPQYKREVENFIGKYNVNLAQMPVEPEILRLVHIDAETLRYDEINQYAAVTNGSKSWIITFYHNGEQVEQVVLSTSRDWEDLTDKERKAFEGAGAQTVIEAAEMLAGREKVFRIDGQFDVWKEEPETMTIYFKNGKAVRCFKETRQGIRTVTIEEAN